MAVHILGLSAYSHDSAAALLRDGRIVAAAQEERFTRRKFDSGFPAHAARFCLGEAGLRLADVDHVVFHDGPTGLQQRDLETALRRDLRSLARAAGDGGGAGGGTGLPPLLFCDHHRSHAASAFFASPFRRAATLCLDGVGVRATTSAWLGEGNRLRPLWEIRSPHSLGLLYSAFTGYCGFRVNSGEYKLMGLAPYGEPRYVDRILGTLIDVEDDGAFRLNVAYFNSSPSGSAAGLPIANDRFASLFGAPPRAPESPLEQRHMDLARSIQAVTEEVVLRLARGLHARTGAEHLCVAGGMALNCVANGRLLREGPFRDLWVQPSAGDAGGALGGALSAWHEALGRERAPDGSGDLMQGGYLGPAFDDGATEAALRAEGAVWQRLADDALFPRVASILAGGGVVGWMQGRMEFGPRALGARSILGDARRPQMQSVMNLKIKHRESFRPFAPAVLAERVGDYFEHDRPSPYMLLTVPVHDRIRLPLTDAQRALSGLDRLGVPRSTIPAVTHVDHSARIQTVRRDTSPRFWRLLKQFEDLTGCGVLINTSFNVRGEPIVCTPRDAYRCFLRTAMDYLVIGNCLLARADQPMRPDDDDWRREFPPD